LALLSDHNWKTSYDSDDLSLVGDLYVPAMDCAVRYHRATGYFNARALALAARGIEGLLRNDGHMKLLVGCTLAQAEVEAIEKGQSLLGTVHDADVYAEKVARYCRRPRRAAVADEQHEAVGALMATLRQERGAALADADALWRTFTRAKAQEGLARAIRKPKRHHGRAVRKRGV